MSLPVEWIAHTKQLRLDVNAKSVAEAVEQGEDMYSFFFRGNKAGPITLGCGRNLSRCLGVLVTR